MGELKSEFSRTDIETLLESMDEWESVGNDEWRMMDMLKQFPDPPENHEAYETWKHIKEHFRNREKSIKAQRSLRQEKATFIKAKLLLTRQDMATNQLFTMAAEANETEAKAAETTIGGEFEQQLKDAEFYIKDLGVWDRYQAYLKDLLQQRQNSG